MGGPFQGVVIRPKTPALPAPIRLGEPGALVAVVVAWTHLLPDLVDGRQLLLHLLRELRVVGLS